MCKKKWNNKCFVICSFAEPAWKIRCHNMEQRVGSKRFFAKVNGAEAVGNYEAVSARSVLQGYESDFIKRFKLRRAIRRCSTVYVVSNTFSNMEASLLYEYAVRKDKVIIHEEETR